VKVLIYTNLYPSTVEPTRGIFNKLAFTPLARLDEVRVIAPTIAWARWSQSPWSRASSRAVRPQGTWQLREVVDGVDVLYPSYWSIPTVRALHAGGMHLSMRPWVKEIRRDFPFDVILAAWAYPDGVAAAALARELDVPLVTVVLGSDVTELPDVRGLGPQIRWGLRRAQRVLAVSRSLADRVVELGVSRERVVVQHNGVDGARFKIRDRDEARRAVGVAHDRPVIGYIGNIRHVKGTDVLIDAMDHLVKKMGDTSTELWVVGAGEIEAQVKRQVADRGLGERVRFCGLQRHEDIPTWMSALDVFCLASRREGCPNVILEALASGKPVVASRVGGVPELLREANGILVPPEDPPVLARALKEALGRTWDPEAQRASVESLSWDAVGRTYHTMLGEVVAEHKKL